MKTKLFFLFFTACCLNSIAQNVAIPDATFKAALVANTSLNTNSDSEIQVTEASVYSGTINIGGLGVSDMTGIEAFPEITSLQAFQNNFTSIDVSQNTKLTQLLLETNYITGELDLSMMSNLTDFKGFSTGLTAINMANGNNANVTRFNVVNAHSIDCIQIDPGFVPNSDWDISSSSSYSENCPEFSCVVTIPDANFKAALVANTAINTNGNSEIECAEATAYNGVIVVDGLSISDLTGIEAFTSITQLSCSNNQLTSLDVSNLPQLLAITCRYNQLTSLDVSANTNVFYLAFEGNTISSIDVSMLPSLIYLKFRQNQISTLDISNNPVLKDLDASLNNLSSLDFSNNPEIETVSAFSNNLTAINLTNTPDLMYLFVWDNPLTALDVTTSVDLLAIGLGETQLTTLDLSNNTLLTEFTANDGLFTDLDFSHNPDMYILYLEDNDLTTLNLASGNNAALSNFTALNNPNLTCIQVDAGFTPPSTWGIDSTVSYSANCNGVDTTAPVAVCQNITIQLDALGEATIIAPQIDGGSSDDTGITTLTISQFEFDCSDLGPNTVTLTVSDAAGNTDSCTAIVTVEDNLFPTAPNGVIDLDADAGQCSAVYNYQFIVSDNCGISSTTYSIPSGTAFPVGSTSVAITVTDTAGNATNGVVTIIVSDVEDPTIVQPTDIVVNSDSGVCSAVVSLPTITVNDNCSSTTFTTDAPTGLVFSVGTTTVTITGMDASGNTATETFNVTVEDNEAPSVQCPSTQTVVVPQGNQYSLPDYITQGDVTATDNCGIASLTQTPAQGTLLAVGMHQILFQTTDTNGNMSDCTLNLTVDEILGVGDHTVKTFKLYPNPASTQITIEGDFEIATVVVHNVLGQRVLISTSETVQIQDLTSGTYFVTIIDREGNSATKRMIKE